MPEIFRALQRQASKKKITNNLEKKYYGYRFQVVAFLNTGNAINLSFKAGAYLELMDELQKAKN